MSNLLFTPNIFSHLRLPDVYYPVVDSPSPIRLTPAGIIDLDQSHTTVVSIASQRNIQKKIFRRVNHYCS